MIHRIAGCALLCCAMLSALSCTPSRKEESPVKAQIERFAPVTLTGDTTRLSPGDRKALQKLVEAARVMDTLYLRQVWSGATALRERLAADTTPDGALRLRYFDINMSPWSGLDHEAPFIDGVPPKPPQANYYPADMTSGEFTTWVASLPDDQQRAATGFFTVIRRDPAGKLTAVPYSTEYRDLLERAAALLRDAAASTDNVSLKRFLTLRADAFLSNDYYQSDVAWMDLDSPVEPTIGPYEVYLDQLFNYKAAFEAFITLRNDEETAKLARFSAELQGVENHLPIEPGYRNPRLGAMAPIRVVDEVALGGEARAGVQTAAFNLPNDERVTQEKGSKRVMLKNVQEAKFRTILTPIADRSSIRPSGPTSPSNPFFTHILAHELMHGLGPHAIMVEWKAHHGPAGDERAQLRDRGSQGGHLRTVHAPVPDRPGNRGPFDGTADVRHVPGGDLPLDAVRDQGGARTRHGPAVQFPDAGRGDPPRRGLRHLRRRPGTNEAGRSRADARDHDHPGEGGLRGGECDPGQVCRDAPRHAEGAFAADRHPGGYRAGVSAERVTG